MAFGEGMERKMNLVSQGTIDTLISSTRRRLPTDRTATSAELLKAISGAIRGASVKLTPAQMAEARTRIAAFLGQRGGDASARKTGT